MSPLEKVVARRASVPAERTETSWRTPTLRMTADSAWLADSFGDTESTDRPWTGEPVTLSTRLTRSRLMRRSLS